MRKMKVIFLDIDGVLNCTKTPNPRSFPYVVDEQLLLRLQKMLARTGAEVVLSSTWRCDPVGLYAAKYYGVPFIDTCPDLPDEPRSKEVLAWLSRHPEATRYAIIDDEDDDLDELPLFQPSRHSGITPEIVEGVARYLNGETDETMRANIVTRLAENIQGLFERDKS